MNPKRNKEVIDKLKEFIYNLEKSENHLGIDKLWIKKTPKERKNKSLKNKYILVEKNKLIFECFFYKDNPNFSKDK